jgi:HSP20 family protein
MTFYYYSPTPPRHSHRMERMMREMRPEGAACCEEHGQPGMHGHEGHRHGFRIPMDVESREDAFVISAMVPGIKAEDVDIQIEGEILTIEGEIKFEEDEKANWLMRERPRGRFSRRIELPAGLEAEKAQASFADGILTLTIPKAPEARPRTIKVNVK